MPTFKQTHCEIKRSYDVTDAPPTRYGDATDMWIEPDRATVTFTRGRWSADVAGPVGGEGAEGFPEGFRGIEEFDDHEIPEWLLPLAGES